MTFDPRAITPYSDVGSDLEVLNEFANKIAEAVPAGSETPTYYISASTPGISFSPEELLLARRAEGRAHSSRVRQHLRRALGRAWNAVIWGLPDPLVVSLKTAYLGRAIADAVAAQAEPIETMRALRLETNKNLVYRWWRRSPHPEVRNYAKQRYMELHK